MSVGVERTLPPNYRGPSDSAAAVSPLIQPGAALSDSCKISMTVGELLTPRVLRRGLVAVNVAGMQTTSAFVVYLCILGSPITTPSTECMYDVSKVHLIMPSHGQFSSCQ